MSNSFYHKELTDAQWNRIKFVFEEKAKVGRPPLNPRIVFNAIMWILKSGARWRDLPARYGNERMQLLKVMLTGGQIHDSEPAIELLKSVALKGKTILADKAYSCEHIRCYLQQHGALACIPDKANFRIKHDFDSQLYKQRNIVERFFQRIKNYRHISTRYDKLAFCFENFVLLAASVIHF